ncbi:MAG: hypothetical protein Q8Q88_05875 [Phenylobacterium sp.]|uniref:hypothetical protein n=1 Tax=Phenylobacterium sp. TaxID=1871053 RepID=UPI0027325B33|nr:hypothetical protein [Phenylobacterium sp.]MDP3746565.1 hypothetical protein [Phenylobacterium sp.]
MFKVLAGAAGSLLLASTAMAHEVWIERDAGGPARIFLGEPDYPRPVGADPEFPKLKAPLVFTDDPSKPAALTRKADHIEAAVQGSGDVRLVDANVFEPDPTPDGGFTGRIYYAKAGRSETRSALDFEVVPRSPGSDQFQILFKGQPVREGVRITNPEGWVKNIKSDAEGRFSVPTPWKGRYLVTVDRKDDAGATLFGKPVKSVTHITTVSFTVP